MKDLLKQAANLAALIVVLPAALLCGFGRVGSMFELFAAIFAIAPGLPGSYLRVAFYHLTLEHCSLRSHISFGTLFAHRQAHVGDGVYIGAYCIVGRCRIGARTQIASQVQILSGSRQHSRDEEGNITGAEHGVFVPVEIGANCWIGAGAIVMADVGEGTTIGAGSVVTRAVPSHVVAVGNPARILRDFKAAGQTKRGAAEA
jgi:acetyltransferase-like isoleucine patch superfamily enzyme